MQYLAGKAVAERIQGLISEKHQRHHYETDLTVRAIYRVTGPGSVDFGGSEETEAPRDELSPVKRSDQDQYGWWDLGPGSYVVRFNETPHLEENQIAFLQPHERLMRAGALHGSYNFRETREFLETTIMVGSGGIRIKENARVSKLLVLRI